MLLDSPLLTSMKTRLLAIDLDGTLLTHDKKITPETKEAIKAAQDAGIIVVLASGRIRPSMLPFARTLGLDEGPMISGNGTHAQKSASEDLYRLHMSRPAIRSIIDYAKIHDLHLNLYTADRLFFLRETLWGDLYRSRVETVIPETLAEEHSAFDFLKVMVVSEPNALKNHRTNVLVHVDNPTIRATESEARVSGIYGFSGNQRLCFGAVGGFAGSPTKRNRCDWGLSERP